MVRIVKSCCGSRIVTGFRSTRVYIGRSHQRSSSGVKVRPCCQDCEKKRRKNGG